MYMYVSILCTYIYIYIYLSLLAAAPLTQCVLLYGPQSPHAACSERILPRSLCCPTALAVSSSSYVQRLSGSLCCSSGLGLLALL